MTRGEALVNLNWPVSRRTNPHNYKKKNSKKCNHCEKGFHPPYKCFHLHPEKGPSSKNAHPSQTPMPLREDLEGTKKTGPPAPISTSNEKRRTEAQNERPVLPQENGRRQTAARRRLTLICLQVEPRTRSTWYCYTRRSSCGLTTGSISDRRKVNFPKTFYTLFPRIFPLRPLLQG